MEVTILNLSAKAYSALGFCTLIEGQCGKHKLIVDVSRKSDTGEISQVWVVVQNASHKAWRGIGKHFPSVQAALERYKTPEIQAVIEAAVNMQAPCEENKKPK